MRGELSSSSIHVATEPICPTWTGSSVVDQIPAKGMLVNSNLLMDGSRSEELPKFCYIFFTVGLTKQDSNSSQ